MIPFPTTRLRQNLHLRLGHLLLCALLAIPITQAPAYAQQAPSQVRPPHLIRPVVLYRWTQINLAVYADVPNRKLLM